MSYATSRARYVYGDVPDSRIPEGEACVRGHIFAWRCFLEVDADREAQECNNLARQTLEILKQSNPARREFGRTGSDREGVDNIRREG